MKHLSLEISEVFTLTSGVRTIPEASLSCQHLDNRPKSWTFFGGVLSNHRGGVIHVKFAKGGIWLKHMQVVLLEKTKHYKGPQNKNRKKHLFVHVFHAVAQYLDPTLHTSCSWDYHNRKNSSNKFRPRRCWPLKGFRALSFKRLVKKYLQVCLHHQRVGPVFLLCPDFMYWIFSSLNFLGKTGRQPNTTWDKSTLGNDLTGWCIGQVTRVQLRRCFGDAPHWPQSHKIPNLIRWHCPGAKKRHHGDIQ